MAGSYEVKEERSRGDESKRDRGGNGVEREEVTGWEYRSGSSIDRGEGHRYGGKQGTGVVVACAEPRTEETNVARIDGLAETRGEHIRSGERLNSRVGLTVEWEEGGKALQAKGYTVDISPKGCMAIVEHGPAVGQRLRVVNGVNGKVVEGTLIWRGHEGRKGWEVGLELAGADGDFWGMEF